MTPSDRDYYKWVAAFLAYFAAVAIIVLAANHMNRNEPPIGKCDLGGQPSGDQVCVTP